jgi:signal transduction histidine kinase
MPAVVAVPFLLILLTWLLMSGLNLNSATFDNELQALEDYTRYERAIYREVLTARAGLSRNYDSLVRVQKALEGALDRVQKISGSDPREIAAINNLTVLAGRQEDLIEQFKTQNALLRNSFAYFEVFSSHLSASGGPAVGAATSLAAAMLHLTLGATPASASAVQDRLNELAALPRGPGDGDEIRALLAHGGMLHDLLPATDSLLKELFTVSTLRDQEALHVLAVRRQLDARASARKFRFLLYAVSVALLALLVYLGLKLRARAFQLQRRATFEHVIAGISTRFINSRHHELGGDVQNALGELADCLGADRAYFLVGEPVRAFTWFREGLPFPPGWPEGAVGLASKFPRVEDCIIRVPHVTGTEDDDDLNALADAGLTGWLCVQCPDGGAILGFDLLRPGVQTQWHETGLLRMAFDAIANAFHREVLERDKERLETSLQQARRMETIGALTSGIAHNFNNIVGAILGYTEMAVALVEPGSRPARGLGEIRRAGERAGELIDQIMRFGRREDGPRQRISVQLLVNETESLLHASLPSHVGLVVHKIDGPAFVSGEPAQLQQVILNLCNNASQAMDAPGTVEIIVEARESKRPVRIGGDELPPGRYIVTSVVDPGRGMDEATLERIFEPFFTTRVEGNGLGLATVREIVREHGGGLNVRTAVGAGTRFEVWLPSAPAHDPFIAPQALPSPRISGMGETVLVMETNRERLLRHEEILAALGYEPVGFTESGEAAAACREERLRFDAALLCQRLGTSSALDLALELHRIAPALPIILATNSAADLGSPLLASAGISGLVSYPPASGELARAFDTLFGESVRAIELRPSEVMAG